MFYQYQQTEKPETLEVCGIPFSVSRNERGVVRKIDRETLAFPAACEALFFWEWLPIPIIVRNGGRRTKQCMIIPFVFSWGIVSCGSA